MPVSNDLFDVIRVMTRKEKSFFRRFYRLSSGEKKGSMLEVFEKMVVYADENEAYDEELFKKQLAAKDLKHFPVVKNNLNRLVLRSLYEYTGEQSVEEKVKSLVEQFDLLFSKSLLKQSGNVLMKAKKIARECELFTYLHDILTRERTLARYTLDAQGYGEASARIYNEQLVNLDKMKNYTDIIDLGSRFTTILQKYPTARMRDESDLKLIKEVMESPLLDDESGMLSRVALSRFYNLKLVAAEWNKDFRNSLKFARLYADQAEEEVAVNNNIHGYIISLNSLFTAAVRSGDMVEYERAYEKLSSLSSRFAHLTERDRVEAFYCLGLAVFSSSADDYHPERGEELLEEAEKNFRQIEKGLSIQQQIVWYFVVARYCFIMKTYEHTGRWLNRLIALPAADVSQDYQCYARIMNLIVAYESGNPDSIDHALRRAYYFLTKRNKVYMYEKIILEYIRKSFRIRTQEEINEMLVFMHRDLVKIQDDPFEENAFDAFNIIVWLEKKISV